MMQADDGTLTIKTALTFQYRLSTDAILESLPPNNAIELQGDLDAMPRDVAQGICPSPVVSAQNTWWIWCYFCKSINVDPGLGQF
jgi:hypothetical protein